MPGDPLSRSARGVYGISVASEFSGFDPQTLRLYERRGLVTPARTDGGTRRYSDDDLDRLARISELVGAGINIAGILQILNLGTPQYRTQVRQTASQDRERRTATRSRLPEQDWEPMTINPEDNPLADGCPSPMRSSNNNPPPSATKKRG